MGERATIMVTGATGLLGGYVVEELTRRGDRVVAVGGPARGAHGLDLEDAAAVEELVGRVRPDVVIHAAAMSAMSECLRDPERARRVNVEGTAHVARAASERGIRLVHVSTDLVFDGEHAPYGEEAPTAPTSVYGSTKRAAELEALSAGDVVVVRVSLLFGPTRTARRGFFDQMIETLGRGGALDLFEDEWRTPLSLRAAAEGLAEIARARVRGVFHLGGPERMSRWAMGDRLARVLGVAAPDLRRVSRLARDLGEPRPRDVSLDSTRFAAAFPSVTPGSFERECARMLA